MTSGVNLGGTELVCLLLLAFFPSHISASMAIQLDQSLDEPTLCDWQNGFVNCAKACMANSTCSQLEVVQGQCLMTGCGEDKSPGATSRAFIKHRCPVSVPSKH